MGDLLALTRALRVFALMSMALCTSHLALISPVVWDSSGVRTHIDTQMDLLIDSLDLQDFD